MKSRSKTNDAISRQAAIEAAEKESQVDGAYGYMDTKSIVDLLNGLPSAQPNLQPTCNQLATDCIDRQAAIDELVKMLVDCFQAHEELVDAVATTIKELQSAQPEPLTDKEQRIFLAAMEREEKVCEEVDRNYVREPHEDSLVRVCKEIRRKVKGALWT